MVSTLIKRLCPAPLKQKIKLACGAPDTDACLAAMKGRGFHPKAAIDIGAYSGEWTLSLRALFPETRVLMIEPQAARGERLRALTQVHDGVEFAPALLGSSAAKGVTFFQAETGSSVLRDPGNGAVEPTAIDMTTLDALTRSTPFERPDFLKLDVQGYELEVLRGAEQVLRSVEAVMMEVNLIAVYEGAPLVDETVAYMAARGFRVYDVCTFFRRPLDHALWQMDMVFVRATSPLMASTRWA
ncbi:MAG TPA: FkbM family methyltransferase [Bryobacteraceae bacterium]|jgi:FkbM family methyltransferase|nr:FkbM family methyltransferase [Bryobacteraceae bacterium]